MKPRIAILQPEVPHYREEFFQKLEEQCKVADIYVYNSFEQTRKHGFNIHTDGIKKIGNKKLHGVLMYNPLLLCSRRYDTLVLMLHFAHVTTWLLLLTKWLHRKKIILWGQGISVKRYLKETKKPDWKLKWQIALADGVWIYEEPEAKQWQHIFPNKPIIALNNTLTGVEEMCELSVSRDERQGIRNKWAIKQDIIFIFCARFDNDYRRPDLLIETIERLDAEKYGFIIIGEGRNKPDFSRYKNVYSVGAVYDNEIKQELFAAADIYIQPGWVGLSIVEAMAYGKPVCTFARSKETLQCVEYCYIEDGVNGYIFNDMTDCINRLIATPLNKFQEMGENAKELVKTKLTPQKMAENAYSVLKRVVDL